MQALDEPVRRYLAHALPAGPPAGPGTRLTMRGRIKVGAWLPFTADWQGDGRSFTWRVEAVDHIVAAWDVPPERPEVHLRIDARGAVRSGWLDHWDNGSHGRHSYIPCGGDVLEERHFGDLVPAEPPHHRLVVRHGALRTLLRGGGALGGAGGGVAAARAGPGRARA